jgi:hypothetical protein
MLPEVIGLQVHPLQHVLVGEALAEGNGVEQRRHRTIPRSLSEGSLNFAAALLLGRRR